MSPQFSYRVSRTLHWLCAITYVFLAVSMPIALDIVSNASERRFAHDIHQSVALLFVVLLSIRFLWIYFSKTSGLKIEFRFRWQYYIARINHWLLYFLMVTTPLSGLVFKVTSGKAVKVFGYELLGVIESLENEDWDFYASEFHLLIISVFYVLIFLHVAGALMHLLQALKERRAAAVS